MEFYFILDGERKGPFNEAQLHSLPLKADTPAWHEGLADWQPASAIPSLLPFIAEEAAFGAYAAPPYQQPQPPHTQYNQPNQRYQPQGSQPQYAAGDPYARQNNGYGEPHTNWLPWAIVGTILGICCTGCLGLIFGILGIVYANQANTAYSVGDNVTGRSKNENAKTMTIISLVLAGIGMIGSIIYFLIYGAIGLAAIGSF